MIAARRSAARAARPEAGLDGLSCGATGLAAAVGAAFFPRRRLAGFASPAWLELVGAFVMSQILTDWSVNFNRREAGAGSHRRDRVAAKAAATSFPG